MTRLKLALGPILFYWPRQQVFDFYEAAAASPVDVIYLGEAVCNKRHQLRIPEWLDLARYLADSSAKEVVISSLILSESSADLTAIRKVVDNHGLTVEANDQGAVQLAMERGIPFVCGPTLNVYNARTLGWLAARGARRWVMPVDMDRQGLQTLLQQRPAIETEVFAWGKLPLALSARCFTARHLELTKDNCQYRCIDYPDGLELASQEGRELFTINGIQTLSPQPMNLLAQLPEMAAMGVDVVRLSPAATGMAEVLAAFDRTRRGGQGGEVIASDGVNGYWFGQPGMVHSPPLG